MLDYEPKHLKRWTMPSHYAGAVWPAYYGSGCGQSRDSDALERSNFECMAKALKEWMVDDLVVVVRESHWAVGWVEWIAIHQDAGQALQVADDIQDRLQDYPVIDEDHWSELEQEEANEVWTNCYSAQERVDYIRKHRSQFEFHDYSDLLGCVRGKYFAGYASEFLN